MAAPPFNELVLQIYRCVTPATPWDAALDSLHREFGARDAILRIASRGVGAKHSMFAAGSTSTPETIAMWENVSPYDLVAAGGLSVDEGRIIRWSEVSIPVADKLEQLAIGSTMMVCVDTVDGAECVLHCNRSLSQPPFTKDELERLRQLAPHFRNAMRIRRELAESEMARHVHAAALNRLGIAAFLVNSVRQCTALNDAARCLLARGGLYLQSSEALRAADHGADRLLQRTLSEAIAANSLYARSLLLDSGAADDEESTGHLHVAVCSWSAVTNVFEKPEQCALVYVRDGSGVSLDDEKPLRALFGFTPAEARVAILLMRFASVRDVAAELGVAEPTVRAHMRAIYGKADVGNRSELASLIHNSLVALTRTDEPG